MPKMHLRRYWFLLALLAAGSVASADDLDTYVKAQMKKHGVPGISIAIIHSGKIVSTRCYGVLEAGTNKSVTPTTLFQAGSISKSVAAIGVLRLVELGKLSLDEDVNAKLTSWKVPENEFTKTEKVTLKRILSHTAGMTVHGFPGYAVDAQKPDLINILDGSKPANTPSIVVEKTPGTVWNYSGGGYTVMQQLVLDVTKTPYADFMKKTVLDPAGMTDSSYEQPQPADRAARTACGTYQNGAKVKGRWHIYPEMAAAGLWTTPTDLAHFMLSVQHSYAGQPGGVLAKDTAQQMLTEVKGGDGLGAFVEGKGSELRFSHSGRDEGFDAIYQGYASIGEGAAVMLNANEDSGVANRILKVIAGMYDWTGAERLTAPNKIAMVHVAATRLAATAGYYSQGEQLITVAQGAGKLALKVGSMAMDDMLPQGNDTYLLPDQGFKAQFAFDSAGVAVDCKLLSMEGKLLVTMPRLSGLLRGVRAKTDPDPNLTKSVADLLLTLKGDSKPLAQAGYLAPGAQRDFANGLDDFKDVSAPEFIHIDELTGHKLNRHGGQVAKVAEFRVRHSGRNRFLFVYLTATGLITDVDLADD